MLSKPTQDQFIEMMNWFKNPKELRTWAGPNFRHPYDLDTFTNDLNLNTIESFIVVSKKSELLAFGQCYNRLNRCHLGRLVVAPKHRGKNLVSGLMILLIAFGTKKWGVNETSLFVMTNNEVALNAYFRFGFKIVDYPEAMPISNCYYMVK